MRCCTSCCPPLPIHSPFQAWKAPSPNPDSAPPSQGQWEGTEARHLVLLETRHFTFTCNTASQSTLLLLDSKYFIFKGINARNRLRQYVRERAREALLSCCFGASHKEVEKKKKRKMCCGNAADQQRSMNQLLAPERKKKQGETSLTEKTLVLYRQACSSVGKKRKRD